jgi:hypothetical protein
MAQRDARIIAVVGGDRPAGWGGDPPPAARALAGSGADQELWRWLRANEIDLDTAPTLAVHPEALTVREWLERKQSPTAGRRPGRTSA